MFEAKHGRVYENGQQLPEVVESGDVFTLQCAESARRLEWDGYEALPEEGQWTIYEQTDQGLRRETTVATLGEAWLYINHWR